MKKLWHDDAWNDYLYWQTQDKKTLKKINRLLKDIDRNGYQCTGIWKLPNADRITVIIDHQKRFSRVINVVSHICGF